MKPWMWMGAGVGVMMAAGVAMAQVPPTPPAGAPPAPGAAAPGPDMEHGPMHDGMRGPDGMHDPMDHMMMRHMMGMHRPPPPPPSKAARFVFRKGDAFVSIKCAEDENMKACVDAGSALLDKLNSVQPK